MRNPSKLPFSINDPKSSKQARGVRLQTARDVAGLTRAAFSAKYKISASTLQSWEAAKAGGLTEKGAIFMVDKLQDAGVNCSLIWLLYGIGEGAQPISAGNPPSKPVISEEERKIIQELQVFRTLNPQAIDMIVTDDGMAPRYLLGDYVAGQSRTGGDLVKLIGHNCIVRTSQNEQLLRRIKPGKQPGRYNLVCVSPETSVFETTLYDAELVYAAKVVWHRRILKAKKPELV
jgi:HTH-type transcriptional regulator, cell division transcriptional repressor